MMQQLMQMMQGMDEEQAQQLFDQLDEEQIQAGVKKLVDSKLVPHLHEVRDNVQTYPDSQEVRQRYAGLPEHKQQELFDEAVREVLVISQMLRERPIEGAERLKGALRDPRTIEALLLIFENENIDPEYRDQLKDFAAEHLHWMGVFAMPEMYHDQEVQRVLDLFDIDPPNR